MIASSAAKILGAWPPPVAQPVPAPLADHVQDHRAGVQRRVQQRAEPVLVRHRLQLLFARRLQPQVARQLADRLGFLDGTAEDEVGSQELAEGIVQEFERDRPGSSPRGEVGGLPLEPAAGLVDEEEAAEQHVRLGQHPAVRRGTLLPVEVTEVRVQVLAADLHVLPTEHADGGDPEPVHLPVGRRLMVGVRTGRELTPSLALGQFTLDEPAQQPVVEQGLAEVSLPAQLVAQPVVDRQHQQQRRPGQF